jgi:hypothetical protein
MIHCCTSNPCTRKINAIESRPRRYCAWFFFALFWWWLFRGIIQFFMFHWAVQGCNADALDSYRFPGADWTCPTDYGDPHTDPADWHLDISADPHVLGLGTRANGAKCKYSPRDNAVPRNELLRERAPSFFGQAFSVYENHGAGAVTSAAVGIWWRTWGPWFWTYTYEDIHGKTSIYMRPSIMGMIGPYSETRIMRCDEEGDVWYFGEGAHWITNMIYSSFSFIFGSTRERTFILYRQRNGESMQYGNALETFHGDKSISFNKGFGSSQVSLGSSILTSPPDDHPNRDFWTLSKQNRVPFHDFPPYYVMSAASMLMAFRWITVRKEHGCGGGQMRDNCGGHSSPSPPPNYFLAETSNASATFFEESKEDGAENAHTEEDAVGEKV